MGIRSTRNKLSGSRTRRPWRRLWCDRLEDRTVPSTVAWDGGPTGNGTNWLDPVNWVGDVQPGAADDVTIGSMGSNPTISLGGTATANSVSSTRALSITGSLAANGLISLTDLTLTNATLTTPAGVTVSGGLQGSGIRSLLGGGGLTLLPGAVSGYFDGIFQVDGP